MVESSVRRRPSISCVSSLFMVHNYAQKPEAHRKEVLYLGPDICANAANHVYKDYHLQSSIVHKPLAESSDSGSMRSYACCVVRDILSRTWYELRRGRRVQDHKCIRSIDPVNSFITQYAITDRLIADKAYFLILNVHRSLFIMSAQRDLSVALWAPLTLPIAK